MAEYLLEGGNVGAGDNLGSCSFKSRRKSCKEAHDGHLLSLLLLDFDIGAEGQKHVELFICFLELHEVGGE